MAIPTFVGEGTPDAVDAASTVSPTNPSSLAVDDILVCWVVSGDDDQTITFPGDWTKIDESPHDDPAGGKGAIAWRRVENTDESDDVITVTQTGNTNQLYAGIFAVRGCKTTGDFYGQALRIIGDGVMIVSMAEITTTVADSLLICVGVIEDNRTTNDDATDYTRQFVGTTSVGSDAGYVVFYQDAASITTYAADSATHSLQNENVVSWTIDFMPETAGDDTTTKTITGKSAIRKTTTKTITGKSAIRKTTTKTITGKSRIQKSVTKTITGKSAIRKTTTKTITGKSRIQKLVTKTIDGKSAIRKTTTKTITGKSRIQKSVTETIDGKSRIQKSVTKTITGKASISVAGTITKTITGKSRIQKSVTETLGGKSRIQKSVTETLDGKSRIQKSVTETIDGKSAIRKTTTKTILGKAKIAGELTFGIPTVAITEIETSVAITEIETSVVITKIEISVVITKIEISVAITEIETSVIITE